VTAGSVAVDIITTGVIEATADLQCIVTSSMQFSASTSLPVGSQLLSFKNGEVLDGYWQPNGTFSVNLIGTGSSGYQPEVTVSDELSITAGHKAEFGVHLLLPAVGGSASVQTTYECA
jgi:hypothetical protein